MVDHFFIDLLIKIVGSEDTNKVIIPIVAVLILVLLFSIENASATNSYYGYTASGSGVINYALVVPNGITITDTSLTEGLQPPSVSIDVTPTPVIVGTLETLSATITDPACAECTQSSFSYAWTLASKPAGSSATLSSPNVATPTFTPDVPGDYSVGLTITDALGDSATASKSIVVAQPPNVSPTVSPNPVQLGATVTLDAGPSSCCESTTTFSYAWDIVSAPSGSSALLSDTTVQKPTFTPDAVGMYQFSVVATDLAGLSSAPGFVTLTTQAINEKVTGEGDLSEGIHTSFTLITDPDDKKSKKGEFTYDDKLGRVKVQFHWDRKGSTGSVSAAPSLPNTLFQGNGEVNGKSGFTILVAIVPDDKNGNPGKFAISITDGTSQVAYQNSITAHITTHWTHGGHDSDDSKPTEKEKLTIRPTPSQGS